MTGHFIRRVLCVLLLAPLLGFGPPIQRDVWYVLVDGEVQYGSHHVVVAMQADGTIEYTISTHVKINLFGAQPQDMKTHGTYRCAADYRVLAVDVTHSLMSGDVVVSGKVDATDRLNLTIDNSGTVTESTYELGPGEPVVLDVCLEDLLAQTGSQVDERRFRVLGTDSWTISEVIATRDDVDPSRWTMTSEGSILEAVVVFGPDRIAAEHRSRTPKVHMRRTTAEEAADITYRIWTGRELLTFPLDRSIGPPDQLTSLQIELTWRDIPFDQFRLNDQRQRVIESTEQDGAYRALVEISRVELDAERQTIEADPAEMSTYLAESDFIKPQHEEIAQTARSIVDENATALDNARRLSEWVYANVEATMIAETLSGPDVLERRIGKCTEFSTLYASLARSAGIPTRVALGERLVGGQWMGHMWNESYVGEWVTVDASANEVGTSMELLKFIDSDTVSGTQSLRWLLTESLEIRVKDFTRIETELSRKYTTGIEGATYTSVEHECQLTAPSAEWRLEDRSSPGVVTVRLHAPGAEDAMIHFVAFSVPKGTRAKDITTGRLTMIRQRFGEVDVLADEPIDVAGVAGHTTRFEGEAEQEPGVVYRTTEVVWICDTHGYLLNLIGPVEVHQSHTEPFEKIIESFRTIAVAEEGP